MRSFISCLAKTMCLICLGGCEEGLLLRDQRPVLDLNREIIALARAALAKAQRPSVLNNVEYCGYIVAKPDRSLVIIGPKRGTRLNCRTPLVYKPDVIMASFHTHGGFDRRVRTEIPSILDFQAAQKEKVDSFIGTPGGRFWRIDYKTEIAQQLCPQGECLPGLPAPAFHRQERIPQILRRAQVAAIERSGR